MKKLIISILTILLFMGCSHVGKNPAKDYYLALGTWYDISKQFQAEYPNLKGKEKEIADKEVRPLLLDAKDILDIWKKHRDSGLPISEDFEAWMEIKSKILKYTFMKLEEK